MEPRKQAICDALHRWLYQRPGLEFGNYGDVAAYRAELRSIQKDLRDANTLLSAVSWRDGIDADALIKAAEGAFSGRLTIKLHFATSLPSQIDCDTAPPTASIDYVTGQYWPTEYRRAVCAVLASALWTYTRETSMSAPDSWRVRKYGAAESEWASGHIQIHEACRVQQRLGSDYYIAEHYAKKLTGDWLRAHFRKEFGRGLASRWFS